LAPSAAAIEQARRLVSASRRPLFVVGLGGRAVGAALRRAVEDTNIPVLATYKAKGIIPESWPNAGPLFTGGAVEAPLLEAADLIVAVGFDPVEAIPGPWPYSAPLLSLAEWSQIGAYIRPDLELVGPLEDALAAIAPHLSDGWETGRAQDVRRDGLERLASAHAPGLSPIDVVRLTRAAAPAGTVATVDAGAHMLAAMPFWEVEAPGETVISSGLATMGFALPAAIAAALARPERRVVCFTGDGGLGMMVAELETLVRLRLDVTVVLLNDAALSLIEIKQRATGHGGRNAVRYAPTNFAVVASGYGIRSSIATQADELRAALEAGFSIPGPFLVDVRVDPHPYREILRVTRG
jgi:acetolactate synthase-1/2/3 large subunit